MRNEDIGAWVGERLRQLRTEKALSLRALAKRSGVTTEMASRAERSEKTPSVQTLAKLCEGLDVSLAEFFGGPAGPRAPASLNGVVELLDGVERDARRQVLDGFKAIASGVRALSAARQAAEVGPVLLAASPKATRRPLKRVR